MRFTLAGRGYCWLSGALTWMAVTGLFTEAPVWLSVVTMAGAIFAFIDLKEPQKNPSRCETSLGEGLATPHDAEGQGDA